MPPATSPALLFVSAALMLAVGAILAFGPYVWFIVGRRLYRGEPVLEHEPRQLASWGFIDLIIFGILWIGIALMAVFAIHLATGHDLFAQAHSEEDSAGKLYLMFFDSVARLLAMLAAGLFIVLRTRCSF